MSDASGLIPVLLPLAILLALAGVLAELFRRIGLYPSAGCLLAGIILGPSVLGNFSPDAHRRLYLGGSDLATEARQLKQEHADRLQALQQIEGLTPAAIDEELAASAARLEELAAQLTDAEKKHQAPYRHLVLLGGIPLALLLAALAGLPQQPRDLGGGLRVGLAGFLAAGLSAWGGVTLLEWVGWLEPVDGPRTLLLALLCAAPAVPLRRDLLDGLLDSRAEREAIGAGFWLLIVLIGGLAALSEQAIDPLQPVNWKVAAGLPAFALVLAVSRNAAPRTWVPAPVFWFVLPLALVCLQPAGELSVPIAALLGGWLLAAWANPVRLASASRFLIEGLLAPLMWGYAGLHLQWGGGAWAALVLVVLLASADLRLLGIWAVEHLGLKRGGWASLQKGLALSGGGLIPLCFTLFLMENRWIDPGAGSALILSWGLITLLAGPVQNWMMRRETVGALPPES